MSWLLEIGKGEAATSAFETEIDAYPRSCCVASEEGLLTMCCKAGRGLYWIWIGSSPEFTQISFCWIFKKKKFKWNCFRSWVIDCRKNISNKLRWRSYVLERLLLADLIYLSFVGFEHDFNIQNSTLMISHKICNCQKLFFKEGHKGTFKNQEHVGDSSLPHSSLFLTSLTCRYCRFSVF